MTLAQDDSGLYGDDEHSMTSQDEALLEVLGLNSTYLGDCREDDEIDGRDLTVSDENPKETNKHNPSLAPQSTGPLTVNQNVQKVKLPINVSRHFHAPAECLAIKFPNLLSPDECEELISLGSTTFDYIRHAVHTAPDGTQLMVELQNPNRHKLSVFYHEKWVHLLWNRLQPKLSHDLLGPFLRRETVSMPTGLNPRLRVLKYDAIDNDEFTPHFDATTRVGGKISLLTVLLYLNSGGGQDFQGGETCYLNAASLAHHTVQDKTVVIPQVGTVVIFEHDLYHAGYPLEWGTKYVLRTDLLFDISEEEWEARPIKAAQDKINDVSEDSRSQPTSLSLPPSTVHELILSTSTLEGWTVADQSMIRDALETLGMQDLTIESFCAPGRFALQMMLQDSMRSMPLNDTKKVLIKQLVEHAFTSLTRN